MANRPVFVVLGNKKLIDEVDTEFKYFNGFSTVQKGKSIVSLHEAFKKNHNMKVLEVSTKSDSKLGWALSAFNLQVDFFEGGTISMECAFQGSKIFENGKQYKDLYQETSSVARKDQRLRASGKLCGFQFGDERWELEPKTAFYDWLYINALYKNHHDIINALLEYDAFTDIEFNPKRSINCQARSCAILVSLVRQDRLDEAMSSPETFIRKVYYQVPKQGELF